jgi:hypothetical protein
MRLSKPVGAFAFVKKLKPSAPLTQAADPMGGSTFGDVFGVVFPKWGTLETELPIADVSRFPV